MEVPYLKCFVNGCVNLWRFSFFSGFDNGCVNLWRFLKPRKLTEHDFQVRYKLDELLLSEIDEDPDHSGLYAMDTVKVQSLRNHVSVNSSECAITSLCYNDPGTFLASGCRRGLVYINSLDVRLLNFSCFSAI